MLKRDENRRKINNEPAPKPTPIVAAPLEFQKDIVLYETDFQGTKEELEEEVIVLSFSLI